MDKVLRFFRTIVIAIGAALGVFLGRPDGLLITLICFAVVDYITGVVSASVNHKLNSAIGFKGIAKKLLMFALVGVANLIDVNALSGTAVLRSAVICFYLANEALSIIENAGEIGLPIPKKLKKLIEQLKESDNDDEGK